MQFRVPGLEGICDGLAVLLQMSDVQHGCMEDIEVGLVSVVV